MLGRCMDGSASIDGVQPDLKRDKPGEGDVGNFLYQLNSSDFYFFEEIRIKRYFTVHSFVFLNASKIL